MNKGIISLSFDDGRKDNSDIAMNILEKYNIPTTFNIATAYVEGLMQAASNQAMSKEEVITLGNNKLFEIAGHGDFHKNDFEDIGSGKNKIINWLSLNKKTEIGFASPDSDLIPEFITKKEAEFKKMGFIYARTGLRIQSKFFYRTIMRKLGRILKLKSCFIHAYYDTLMSEPDGIALYSVPILNSTSLNQVKGLVDKAVKEKKLCILMFHSIVKHTDEFASDPWSWNYDKFEGLCQYLHELTLSDKAKVQTCRDAFYELRSANTV